jgi:hypothetical protein
MHHAYSLYQRTKIAFIVCLKRCVTSAFCHAYIIFVMLFCEIVLNVCLLFV